MAFDEEIVKKAKELEDYIVEKRRDFHMHPELKYEEVRTSKIVAEELKKLGYDVVRTAKTGVVGILKGKEEGRTVALRADMDALPVQEENDVPYRSKVPGKMHACGHDAHTAMLLGAAKILADLKDELRGTVKLLFQPAEEGGLGAKLIVEDGHLDDVDAVFGIHVWAELPAGFIGIKEGPLLASADAFKVTIKGKGGHGASPQFANDPIPAAMDIAQAFYKILVREIDPLEPVALSVTSIQAGNTFNVIPETAELLGTFRTFSEDVRKYLVKRMGEIVGGYTGAHGVEASFNLTIEPIPPTINDKNLAEFARETLKPLGEIVEPRPTMGAEDFSLYLKKAPGLFILLGIRNEEKGIIYPHHHPRFDVDESILWKGAAIHALLAYKYLGGGK